MTDTVYPWPVVYPGIASLPLAGGLLVVSLGIPPVDHEPTALTERGTPVYGPLTHSIRPKVGQFSCYNVVRTLLLKCGKVLPFKHPHRMSTAFFSILD